MRIYFWPVDFFEEPIQKSLTLPLQGEVQLWIMRFPQPSLTINEGSVAKLLDAEEFRRWRRFAFYEDAQRFLAGRALLRIALGAALGVSPRECSASTIFADRVASAKSVTLR